MADETVTIERGEPITELVRGSLEYTRYLIRSQFDRAFGHLESERTGRWLWVMDTFADYIVVEDSSLPKGIFWKVSYSLSELVATFGEEASWTLVELSYIDPAPAVAQESADKEPTEKRKFRERRKEAVRIEEAAADKPRVIYATVARGDVVNGNGRRYRSNVLRQAVTEAKTHLDESLSQGRAFLLGEAEHPSDKGNKTSQFLQTIVTWQDLWFDEETKFVEAKGHMVESTHGRDAITLMEAGVLPGISLRGYGDVKLIEEDGRTIEEVQKIVFTGIDLVLDPSFETAAVKVLESKRQKEKTMEEGIIMTIEGEELETVDEGAIRADIEAENARNAELETARVATEAAESQDAAIRTAMNLPEDADITEALEAQTASILEAEAATVTAEVATFVMGAAEETDYPDNIQESFVAFLGTPETMDAAQSRVSEGRIIFDAWAADGQLKAKGFKSGLQVTGPVIEKETGVPAYAVASFAIHESLVKAGKAQPRNFGKPKNRGEAFALAYLERFDNVYREELIHESQLFEEAETASDLNLPTSILRGVAMEAFPQLVAAEIFDVGVVDQSPVTAFFQQAYSGESGSNPTITDESFTSSHDAWVALAQKRLVYGVVVTSDPAGTTYDEGDDYIMDHAEGKIKVLSTGSMADATGFLIDYVYHAIRKGEGIGIERAKVTIASQTLTMAADRLATEITEEAIVFSRSQLGWDAVTETISALIRQVMRRIDANLFDDALNAALGVASNSGGTWTKATDAYSSLTKYLGYAKVKVANRYYDPTFILMSVTNADELSNADLFTQAGQTPGYSIDAAGYVGQLKALPVFSSTEFTDSYMLVGNAQIVLHRVYQPMQLKGPFPTYDSNRELVASEQYFVQEFNGHITPIAGKAAYVKIA